MVFPTLLLLFAHPMNTFSLIVIHVALFYTETMAGVLFMEQLDTLYNKPVCTFQKWLCSKTCSNCKTSNTRYSKLSTQSDNEQSESLRNSHIEPSELGTCNSDVISDQTQELSQVTQIHETPQTKKMMQQLKPTKHHRQKKTIQKNIMSYCIFLE